MGEETMNAEKFLRSGKDIPADFIMDDSDIANERYQIANDITDKFGSQAKAAKQAGIYPGQLSEFISGKKNLGFEAQIRLYLVLEYSYDRVQSLLKRFDAPELYVRRTRDMIISKALLNHWDLYELEEKLEDEGVEGIWPKDYR